MLPTLSSRSVLLASHGRLSRQPKDLAEDRSFAFGNGQATAQHEGAHDGSPDAWYLLCRGGVALGTSAEIGDVEHIDARNPCRM